MFEEEIYRLKWRASRETFADKGDDWGSFIKAVEDWQHAPDSPVLHFQNHDRSKQQSMILVLQTPAMRAVAEAYAKDNTFMCDGTFATTSLDIVLQGFVVADDVRQPVPMCLRALESPWTTPWRMPCCPWPDACARAHIEAVR